MRLGVKHPFIQTHNILLGKQQVKVLQSLSEPEALHLVVELRGRLGNVIDSGITKLSGRMLINGEKHAPPSFSPVG